MASLHRITTILEDTEATPESHSPPDPSCPLLEELMEEAGEGVEHSEPREPLGPREDSMWGPRRGLEARRW